MKMVIVVCPEGRHEAFRNLIEKHEIHAYTEMRDITGEGDTGKKFGTVVWPGQSTIMLIVVSDDKKAEIEKAIKECQSKLYPAEGMRAFVLPVEEVL